MNTVADRDKRMVVRDAASVVLIRDRASDPKVLMGQRGATAAFMPKKFVFPGGALDRADMDISLDAPLPEPCRSRLSDETAPEIAAALPAAAIRELWEETGLVLGTKGQWPGQPPPQWQSYATRHVRPSAAALQFIFRAITPLGRPRRFDARFFLVDAPALLNDPDDFSMASDELSHLQWIPLHEVSKFDLPFITEVVLAEVAARITDTSPPDTVPYFKNNDEESLFLRLGRKGSAAEQDQ